MCIYYLHRKNRKEEKKVGRKRGERRGRRERQYILVDNLKSIITESNP